jgi:hypothetical protein
VAAILSQDIYKKGWRRNQMPESTVKLRGEQHHAGAVHRILRRPGYAYAENASFGEVSR